jgi:hypothetical protein
MESVKLVSLILINTVMTRSSLLLVIPGSMTPHSKTGLLSNAGDC